MIAHLGSRLPLRELAAGAWLLRHLPPFLRCPISAERARAIVRRRLEQRGADFLALARRAIYRHAASPYRRLLQLAGCEYGDLERLVSEEGVEGALRILYRRGVYLTVDEFKGRRPAARGSATIAVGPRGLRNPYLTGHLVAQSGGSRGTSTPVPIHLAHVRDYAVNICLALHARGGGEWLHATWNIPSGTAIEQALEFAAFGAPPARWFLKLGPAAPGLDPLYRWGVRVLRWESLLAGVPLPRPLHVPLERPLPIARWMAEVLRAGRTPHLYTVASSGVRLCQAALDAGIDLRGAQFSLGSEPITEARLAVVRRAGAEAVPRYGSVESGHLANGCLAPEAADDLHLFHDLHALIQPGPGGPENGLPPRALLLSSLRPTAPFILLNVSMGDQAVVAQRACGCPLGHLGWATHLQAIRSFEKLTAGGMTFPDGDVIRVLEEVLPTRFGGVPTDYQLLEEEADDGQPRLRLLVSPGIGPLDAEAVLDAFLGAIGTGSGAHRLMAELWRRAGLLRVERREPRRTASGKIHHLHVERRRPTSPRPAGAARPPPARAAEIRTAGRPIGRDAYGPR